MNRSGIKHRGWNKRLDFQCRSAEGENTDSMTVAGYAAVFNQRTDLGYFTEEIAPGAFKETLEDRSDDHEIVALLNHNTDKPLGRWPDTLRLNEDEDGLFSEIDLPNNPTGQDVFAWIERGDIKQMSFGFYIVREEYVQKEDEKPHFIIQEVSLFDVSPVTFPAYSGTTIEARSEVDQEKELKERMRLHVSEDQAAKALHELRARKIELIRKNIS